MVRGFVLINTQPRKEREVLERLRVTKGVKTANMLYGAYDVVAVSRIKLMSLPEFY